MADETLMIPAGAKFEFHGDKFTLSHEADISIRGDLGGYKFQKISSKSGSVTVFPPEGVDFEVDDDRYWIHAFEHPELSYTTRFIGTRVRNGSPGEAGEVLFETSDNPAVYELRGDELYVRAVVESSRPHPRPYREGDKEMAWLQPHVP